MKMPRDLHVVAMITGRKSGPMKDTRSGRGGSRNTKQDILAEYEADSREENAWDERKTLNEKP